MSDRKSPIRYGRGLRAAPVVAVAIGIAVSGCQGQRQIPAGVVGTTSTTPAGGVVTGSVVVTTGTAPPVAGVTSATLPPTTP